MAIVKTRKGQSILVDDVDIQMLSEYTWSIESVGYAYTNVKDPSRPSGYRIEKMHRMLMGFSKGEGRLVDHINGNKVDNRRANLREATLSQNQWNRTESRNNASGFKGVSFHKATGKWSAYIAVSGRMRHLGLFSTPELAHEVYCKAAREHHGEFANFGTRESLERAFGPAAAQQIKDALTERWKQ
jgi:hypothetical protein